MYPLFESIRLQDGKLYNIPFHQERINRSRLQILQLGTLLNLKEHLEKYEMPCKGLFKIRVAYGEKFDTAHITSYVPRSIHSLQAVFTESIDYSYKFTNRSSLEKLAAQSNADDIIIIRDGLITDTSYSNIIFKNSSGWFTPATPLLRGTQREYLLQAGEISECRIEFTDLKSYTHCKLINAMMPIGDAPEISVADIIK
ncbi:MAG: aminotransferase class IV [Ignavibacteria bacterium]|nr:aminotransferase class IV [Ignavibacteria bacterium]